MKIVCDLPHVLSTFRTYYHHEYTQNHTRRCHMKNERLKTLPDLGGWWSAFIAGGVMGAGLALLLTPQTGSQLRSMMCNYASRAKEEALKEGEAALDTATERGKEFYEKGEAAVHGAWNKV
jgi:YtxH-like protein